MEEQGSSVCRFSLGYVVFIFRTNRYIELGKSVPSSTAWANLFGDISLL